MEQVDEFGNPIEPRVPSPRPIRPTRGGARPGRRRRVIAILAVLVIAWVALDGGGDDGSDDAALAPTTSTTASSTTTTTTTTVVAASPEGVPPDADSLPAGAVLYQGGSGGPIGNIAQGGQSRFLSLERPGLGVGDGSIGAQATTWASAGRVTDFGVTLGTTANRGRYGINLFIDGATYGVGCAIEIGETACSAVPENLAEAPPLAPGQSLTVIVGEQGNVAAAGDYSLSWWFVFQPA